MTVIIFHPKVCKWKRKLSFFSKLIFLTHKSKICSEFHGWCSVSSLFSFLLDSAQFPTASFIFHKLHFILYFISHNQKMERGCEATPLFCRLGVMLIPRQIHIDGQSTEPWPPSMTLQTSCHCYCFLWKSHQCNILQTSLTLFLC